MINTVLTKTPEYSTITTVRTKVLMASSVYDVARKHKYRVTLELDVLGDFDPHQINWDKLFELEHNESVSAYVEDLDATIW